MNYDAVTDNTNLGAVGNLAFNYIATGNLQLGNSNQLTDFYAALDNLFEFRSKHTLDSSLNVVDCVVNNTVGAYVNLLGSAALRALASGRTLKPIISALAADASITSDSVIAPTPAWTTATLTSSFLIFPGMPSMLRWYPERQP